MFILEDKERSSTDYADYADFLKKTNEPDRSKVNLRNRRNLWIVFLVLIQSRQRGWDSGSGTTPDSPTQSLDHYAQYLDAAIKFSHGNKLARAVCLTNITGSEHDRICAECMHLWRFRAKRDRTCLLSAQFFH